MTLFSAVVTTQSDPGAQQDNPRASHFSGPQILSAPLKIQACHCLPNCEPAGARPRVHSFPLQAVSLLVLNLSWAYRRPRPRPSLHSQRLLTSEEFRILQQSSSGLRRKPKHLCQSTSLIFTLQRRE